MFSACTKYSRLKMLANDGAASKRQLTFVHKHESICQQCKDEQATVHEAMVALRSATIEPSYDPSFESRIIRRVKAERSARTVSYWMPAFAGAVVAGAALLAILQILYAAPVKESIDVQGHEANLGAEGRLDIPNYYERSVVTDPTE